MTDGPSELSDDILPEEPQHISREREFAPWHKVRKEFVRGRQWNRLIINLARRFLKSDLQLEDATGWSAEDDIPETVTISRPLRCLVIPGDDLLDIRALYRDTEDVRCYIRYLGFNERYGSDDTNTWIHIANNDVSSLPRVCANSRVLRDRFQSIGNQQSQAYRYVKEYGPFDVVNLDLCDSLFPTISGDLPSYYNALHRIAEYQLRYMATPWLLFITTEVAPAELDLGQFESLCRPTKGNLERHDAFGVALSPLLPVDALGGSDNPIDLSQFDSEQIISLFGVAIGKALLSFCVTSEPRWRIDMLSSYQYRINEPKDVSMLSLAFQFKPIVTPPQDRTGISSIEVSEPAPFNEEELATKLAKAVGRISNIDQLLQNDDELRRELFHASADLLEAAGYNRQEYEKWVSTGETA